ncbi:FkbM family methyltransferase [Cohnella sp. LGH]|uniref:FkbM family methyltransferase n=1 Tax=Cohnella sp. LGH TaxID=1619153 RepID=UPI001ADC244A|nr:FkbM family methyltransferase [Cohnella sp. LGH]QTH42267.1 FkbM family methyltransferase [Cohnella sp. LGH]
MTEVNEINRFFKLSQEAYANLADPTSKALYTARMNYNLTNDYKYLYEMLELTLKFQKMIELSGELRRISEQSNARLIVYGAGVFGRLWIPAFKEFNWYAFCDKDTTKQGTTYCNLPVISPEELIINHKNDYVIIGSPFIYEEVFKELQILGFPADHIVFEDIRLSWDESQYFEAPIITPQPNEVFIDAGCYDCGTALLFKEWCGGDYDKIYAFEPDTTNYRNCQSIIYREEIRNIELLNAGVWSRDDRLQFDARGDSASSIDSEGVNSINVRSIDSVLQGARATFIKMDIEGAELEALKGARETIVKYRPRLAICVYHKPEDMLEIQLFLQSLVPDYQFYIRHYSFADNETVLYAV